MTLRPLSLCSIFLSLSTTVSLGAGCDVLFGTYCDGPGDCPTSAPLCSADGLCVAGAPVDDAGQVSPDGGRPEPEPEPDDGGQPEPEPGEDGGQPEPVGDGGQPEPEGDAGQPEPESDGGQPEPDGGVIDIVIESINGTGSQRLPSDLAPTPGDIIPAARRLEDRLVVGGTGLASVTAAQLVPDDNSVSFALSIADGASDGELVLILPNNITAGLFTLSLVAASSSASAQVFLLQGEPAEGLTCENGDCTIEGNLTVDGTVTAGGAPVTREINESETRQVANTTELVSELIQLTNFRIAPQALVTLQLAEGDFILAAPFFLGHPNASQIRIIGNTAEPATTTIRCAASCISLSRGSEGGFIDGVTFIAQGGNLEPALRMEEGSSFSLGGSVVIDGFATGIILSGASIVFGSPGLHIRNGGVPSTAVVINGLSSAILPGLLVTNCSRGVEVRQGHAELADAVFVGVTPAVGSTGLFVRNGGTAFAPRVSISEFGTGLSATTNGLLIAAPATIFNVIDGVDANLNGLASVSGSTIDNASGVGIKAQTQGLVVGIGVGFNNVTTESEIDADAVFIQ